MSLNSCYIRNFLFRVSLEIEDTVISAGSTCTGWPKKSKPLSRIIIKSY